MWCRAEVIEHQHLAAAGGIALLQDWGYREVLEQDLPTSQAVLVAADDEAGALPWIIGGHSLGGQLACVHAGRNPQHFNRLWLAASGSPFWRGFPPPRGWLLPLVYRFLPEPCARAAVARGQLVIREVEEHKPEETFWLAWRTGEDGAALRWWRERLRRPELLSQWWQAMAKG